MGRRWSKVTLRSRGPALPRGRVRATRDRNGVCRWWPAMPPPASHPAPSTTSTSATAARRRVLPRRPRRPGRLRQRCHKSSLPGDRDRHVRRPSSRPITPHRRLHGPAHRHGQRQRRCPHAGQETAEAGRPTPLHAGDKPESERGGEDARQPRRRGMVWPPLARPESACSPGAQCQRPSRIPHTRSPASAARW